VTVVSMVRSHNITHITKSYELFGDRFTTTVIDDIATSDLSQVLNSLYHTSLILLEAKHILGVDAIIPSSSSETSPQQAQSLPHPLHISPGDRREARSSVYVARPCQSHRLAREPRCPFSEVNLAHAQDNTNLVMKRRFAISVALNLPFSEVRMIHLSGIFFPP
jgi:hypothetical protein